jgi:hypothetical protein
VPNEAKRAIADGPPIEIREGLIIQRLEVEEVPGRDRHLGEGPEEIGVLSRSESHRTRADTLRRVMDEVPMGCGVPSRVERDFRAYLRCGILAHGFARARFLGRSEEGLQVVLDDGVEGRVPLRLWWACLPPPGARHPMTRKMSVCSSLTPDRQP